MTESDTIVRWVAAGSPKGDPKDMPAPMKWGDDAVWNFAHFFQHESCGLCTPCRVGTTLLVRILEKFQKVDLDGETPKVRIELIKVTLLN